MIETATRFWDVAVGLISNFAFWIVLLIGSRIGRWITRSNPVWRLTRLGVLLALGLIIVSVSVWKFGANSGIAFSIFLLGCLGVFLFELTRFWRIGLVGVDRSVATGVDYENALNLCTSSMDFLGIGASKLTQEKRAFERAVDRCNRPDRAIRLLLSRPDNEGLERLARMAGREPSEYRHTVQESLRYIARLRSERAMNIEIRFYREFPAFRLMFVNDVLCLTSHYVLGKGQGRNLPQLHILKTPAAQDIDSLYYAFSFYYNSIWQDAESWDFRSYL